MKTIHVIANTFWNTGKGMSGGDKRNLEFLKRWNKKDECKIVVYAPKKFLDILLEEEPNLKIECRITSTKNSEQKGVITAYMIHTMRAVMQLPFFKRDILFYSASDFLPDIIPCMVGKIFNFQSQWCTVIHHIIESYKTRPGNKITNIISYEAQQVGLIFVKYFSNRIITVSPVVKKYLLKRKFKREKIFMCDNGVDVEYINTLEPYEEVQKHYDAAFLARLAPSKGIFEIPEIWSNVVAKHPNARLAMIGNGTPEVKQQLKSLIKRYNVEKNIDVLGYLENEDAYRYLKSAKVFLFPSHEEGWGISIAEALSCGLPVIAYDLPIYKYVFKYGVFEAPKGNVSKMAELVNNLLDDDKYRNKVSKEGQKFVLKHYDWDVVADKELKLLLK